MNRIRSAGLTLTTTAVTVVVATVVAAPPARAASVALPIDGAALGLLWGVPFIGILLSIAILPQLAPHFWDRRIGSLCAFWAAVTLVPLAVTHGFGVTLDAAAHTILTEYVPFIILLFALYTIAGGIVVTGNLHGSPAVNTGLLAVGTLLASLVGTTGAAMVLIRPLIRANDGRRHNVHVVIFFIFLVANIGGALTPLGDPPLFLGFLRGVDFFWPAETIWAEMAVTVAILLGLFYVLDRYVFARDDTRPKPVDPTPDDDRVRIRGKRNIALVGLAVATIVATGLWRPRLVVTFGSTTLGLQDLIRDLVLLLLGLASVVMTSRRNRAANDFTWRPILEVAKIFAGIFVCMLPVSAALSAGPKGAFAPLLALVSHPDGSPNNVAYFWLTGLLSSVLDNAPTYLVFFDLAGGDASHLMTALGGTLAAISTGAVFMGANTYLGNAPNFMVYAIARQAGVRMPSFFGYLAWSGAILMPLFVLVTVMFVR